MNKKDIVIGIVVMVCGLILSNNPNLMNLLSKMVTNIFLWICSL